MFEKTVATAFSVSLSLVIAGWAPTKSHAFELVIEGEEEPTEGFDYSIHLDGEVINIRQQQLNELIQKTEEMGLTLGESEFEVIRALDSIAAGGGFAASWADLALSDYQAEARCLEDGQFANPPLPVFLLKSNLRLHINPDLDAGHLDIWTRKLVICNINNQIVEQEYTRRWVITVLNGGIIGQKISDGDYVYRLYSVGIPIRVMAYYENGKLVTRLDSNGNPDPRYRFYGVTNEACINIKLKIVPPNDRDIISIPPSHLFFCAGGCGIPGVDATM